MEPNRGTGTAFGNILFTAGYFYSRRTSIDLINVVTGLVNSVGLNKKSPRNFKYLKIRHEIEDSFIVKRKRSKGEKLLNDAL
jgi:hypothetical protein